MAAAPSSLSPDALDPLEEERLWEQQWQLKQYFEKEPHPSLEARRDLATKLGMTEEQVETWFIDQSLEKEMRRRPEIQLTAPVNTYSYSARHRFRSLRFALIYRMTESKEIKPSEPSTSSYWDQYPNLEELVTYEAKMDSIYQSLPSRLRRNQRDIQTQQDEEQEQEVQEMEVVVQGPS